MLIYKIFVLVDVLSLRLKKKKAPHQEGQSYHRL